jgi:hypothetical protein
VLPIRPIAIALTMSVVCVGCMSLTGGPRPASDRASAYTILYSPNGEPLTGGPLGHPSCQDALAGWFSRVDANHDGAIDRDEFMNDARAQFDRMDLGHEGYITSAKLSEYRAPYQERPTDTGMGGQRDPRNGGPARVRQGDTADPVMSADRTLSFKVTWPDFQANAEEVFAQLDNKHRGKLSLEQIQATCNPKH